MVVSSVFGEKFMLSAEFARYRWPAAQAARRLKLYKAKLDLLPAAFMRPSLPPTWQPCAPRPVSTHEDAMVFRLCYPKYG